MFQKDSKRCAQARWLMLAIFKLTFSYGKIKIKKRIWRINTFKMHVKDYK